MGATNPLPKLRKSSFALKISISFDRASLVEFKLWANFIDSAFLNWKEILICAVGLDFSGVQVYLDLGLSSVRVRFVSLEAQYTTTF